MQAESKTARVLFSYESIEEDEISLTEGEVGCFTHYEGKILILCQIVTILSKNVEDENYWRGKVEGREGLFPHCFVEREKL